MEEKKLPDLETQPPTKPQKKTKIIIICLVVFFVLLSIGGIILLIKIRESNQYIDDLTEGENGLTEVENGSTKPENQELNTSSRNNLNGPYYHQVYSATSTDGLTWTKDGKMLFDHSSVPGAVIKNGIIYVYFVDASYDEDQLSVGISKDLGKTYTKEKVEIENVPCYDAVDPHPELVDGQIRLYYLGDFMSMMLEKEEKFTIYSATSDDGIHFKNQTKALVEDSVTTDPDVFKTDDGWQMLLSQGGGLSLFKSSDGGLTFSKDPDFTWDKGGVCDTYQIDSTFYTYYCGNGIELATGVETGTLTTQKITGLQNISETPQIMCDPSVIQLTDGTYLMFYKIQEVRQQPQEDMPPEGPDQPFNPPE